MERVGEGREGLRVREGDKMGVVVEVQVLPAEFVRAEKPARQRPILPEHRSRHAPGHKIPSSVGLRSCGDNQIPSAPTRF
eukprot:71316-Pyramimonas_sp.AAC.1